MNFRIEHEESKREPFGEYRYRIYEDGGLVAYYWHDHKGDEHGIEFINGKEESWPVGCVVDFLQGGGRQPLALSARAVAYLRENIEMRAQQVLSSDAPDATPHYHAAAAGRG